MFVQLKFSSENKLGTERFIRDIGVAARELISDVDRNLSACEIEYRDNDNMVIFTIAQLVNHNFVDCSITGYIRVAR